MKLLLPVLQKDVNIILQFTQQTFAIIQYEKLNHIKEKINIKRKRAREINRDQRTVSAREIDITLQHF